MVKGEETEDKSNSTIRVDFVAIAFWVKEGTIHLPMILASEYL